MLHRMTVNEKLEHLYLQGIDGPRVLTTNGPAVVVLQAKPRSIALKLDRVDLATSFRVDSYCEGFSASIPSLCSFSGKVAISFQFWQL